MITLIILIVLAIVGWYLITKYDYIIQGVLISITSGVFLLVHLIGCFTVEYQYELFVEKGNAFEQTLYEVRKNGNECEVAAIVREISQWNQELAVFKYDNKTIFFDQYIDYRIELIEPIK